jgi:hypothetical protein
MALKKSIKTFKIFCRQVDFEFYIIYVYIYICVVYDYNMRYEYVSYL